MAILWTRHGEQRQKEPGHAENEKENAQLKHARSTKTNSVWFSQASSVPPCVVLELCESHLLSSIGRFYLSRGDPRHIDFTPCTYGRSGGFGRDLLIGLTQMCLEAQPTSAEADIKNCVIGVIAQCFGHRQHHLIAFLHNSSAQSSLVADLTSLLQTA